MRAISDPGAVGNPGYDDTPVVKSLESLWRVHAEVIGLVP